MASPSRPKSPDVTLSGSNWDDIENRLHVEPYRFNFFQAVWLLERIHRAPVGELGDARQEPVRFGTHPSLAFPASEIQSFDTALTPPKMTVNFMGLQGLSGALPHVYTEFIEERARYRDRTLNEFLDFLNHRLISLFYRAWKRYQFALDTRRMRLMLLSLTGLATDGLERRHEVPDDTFGYYAGLLGLQPRSAVALENILSDYFGVDVEVEQFVGAWYTLSPDTTCTFADREDESEQLGLGVLVGDEVWDQQGRIRVRLGPLTRDQYEQFLPGRSGHRKLEQLVRFFTRDQIDFEAQLVLRKEEVPHCRLDDEPVQLGWTTWMKVKPVHPKDVDDTVLELRANA